MAARKHGPYWHQQKALGAEFADRIGFDAAVRYTTTEAEHLATRNAAGLYDVYNQVMVEVRGRDAMKLLRQTLVNDVARINDGKVLYSGEYAEHMWDAVMAAGTPLGLKPCGLGALRTVRMEKRYPLYGLDLDESTSPIEAELGWTVHFNERDFIGREALVRQRAQGVTRKLVLIEFADLAAVPAAGDEIRRGADRATIGKVTPAEPGWHLRRALALGYVGAEHARDGTKVEVTVKAKGGAGLPRTIRLTVP